MEAAFEHLALPLLRVWARCKRGLKHLQFHRLLPVQDNISSSTSSFMSGHAQNRWDLSSLVQSSHLKPTAILTEGKERPFSQDSQIRSIPNLMHTSRTSPLTWWQLLPSKPERAGEARRRRRVWFVLEAQQRESPRLFGVRGQLGLSRRMSIHPRSGTGNLNISNTKKQQKLKALSRKT